MPNSLGIKCVHSVLEETSYDFCARQRFIVCNSEQGPDTLDFRNWRKDDIVRSYIIEIR